MGKRWWRIPALLALLLLLAGCSRNVTDRELTLVLASGETAEGTFSGVLEGLGRTGSGRFLAAEGWSFEGEIRQGFLASGQGTDVPLTVEAAGEALEGVYTGGMEEGLAQGEGSFRGTEGGEAAGAFAAGRLLAGEASGLTVCLEFQGTAYRGAYTGQLEEGLPQGEGEFTGLSQDGWELEYDGGWDGGAPHGRGTLSAQHLTIEWEGEPRTGSYQGQAEDGLPSGQGVFRGLNGENVPAEYDGAWQEGRMHGAGVLTFQADNYFTRTGTFTEGWFTPTFLEALETWGSYEPEFTLSPELKEFLLQYPWIWDEENENLDYEGSAFRTEIQQGLYAGTYMAQPEEYADGVWMRLTSYRIVEARTGSYFDNGVELTQITAVDSGYRQCWRFLVPERMEGLPRAARLDAYVVPLGMSTYTNTLGEEVTCAVALVGDIQVRGWEK